MTWNWNLGMGQLSGICWGLLKQDTGYNKNASALAGIINAYR